MSYGRKSGSINFRNYGGSKVVHHRKTGFARQVGKGGKPNPHMSGVVRRPIDPRKSIGNAPIHLGTSKRKKLYRGGLDPITKAAMGASSRSRFH